MGLASAASLWASEPGPKPRLEIVDRSIAFHGGDRFESSTTTLDVCSKSGCYQVVATVDGGHFALEASQKSGDRRLRVHIDNETVTAWRNGQVEALSPELAQNRRDWVMQRVYFSFLPYRLNDPSVRKEDLGLETWNGRLLHKVKVTFSPGSSTDADDEFMYWFEPSSGRLVQFAYHYDGSPGGLRFRKTFNERRIEGILFLDQENLGVEGDTLTVDMITPDFVASMRAVSTVRLENVRVKLLDR